MANGNPNQLCALLPTFGVEETAGYQGSGWSMGTLDQWAVILQSQGVWKVDQETSGEARQWPGETWEAASWHVPRCPDAPENHWPVCSAGSCREQKAVASGCGRKCGVKVPHTSILSCFFGPQPVGLILLPRCATRPWGWNLCMISFVPLPGLYASFRPQLHPAVSS